MGVMELEDFQQDKIMKKLKKFGKDSLFSRTLVDFAFSKAIQDAMKVFDDKFISNVGAKAYPRLLLLLMIFFCYSEGETNVYRMVKMCRTHSVLNVLVCGKTPSYSTLKSFLKDCDLKTFKKVFVNTLVELNDLDLLKFQHLFIDGTDAIIRGSKYYKLTRKEFKALKLLKKHGLLLKNKNSSIENWQKKIKRKINENTSKNLIKFYDIALLNPNKFTRMMGRKIPFFEEAFLETEKDFICVVFPKANLMPTKKGGYDFAFNLQQIMNENNISIGSLLLQKPNDFHTAEENILYLKENFELLKEMTQEYGSRNNLKEIQKLLDEAIFIMDAGYFSDFNLEKTDEYMMNALIMPKNISTEKNKEFRKRNGIVVIEEEEKKFTKKDFQRVYNGYICPNNQKIGLVKVKEINSIKNIENKGRESWIKKSHVHMSFSCSECPLKEKCIGDKETKIIIDRVSPLSYQMTNKLTNKKFLNIYSPRFQVCESINGYLKAQNGILLLSGSDKNEISNEIHLLNAIYNLKRKVKLKDTLY